MRIAKALKKITKIKGELAELKHRINDCNVALEDNAFPEDIEELISKYAEKRDTVPAQYPPGA